jgi:uncharacterized membrane protein AbrB (regulator of aidB expression)
MEYKKSFIIVFSIGMLGGYISYYLNQFIGLLIGIFLCFIFYKFFIKQINTPSILTMY